MIPRRSTLAVAGVLLGTATTGGIAYAMSASSAQPPTALKADDELACKSGASNGISFEYDLSVVPEKNPVEKAIEQARAKISTALAKQGGTSEVVSREAARSTNMVVYRFSTLGEDVGVASIAQIGPDRWVLDSMAHCSVKLDESPPPTVEP
jgi:uncharacterized protein (DUF1501 family)